MILDNIKNFRLYTGLGPNFKEALELLANDKYKKEPGRYELSGGAFYLVQSYETKPEGVFESHRKYIDLQFIVSGKERHDYAYLPTVKVRDPYSEEKDCALYTGAGSSFVLNSGTFAVYFPDDVHMPNLEAGSGPEKNLKVVVKIPVK